MHNEQVSEHFRKRGEVQDVKNLEISGLQLMFDKMNERKINAQKIIDKATYYVFAQLLVSITVGVCYGYHILRKSK